MARLAILLAGAVLALAGCGTDREPTAAGTSTPTPVATAGRTQPVIAEPPAGATITADTQEDDRYRVAVDVRGVAEPDERVVVSTGCQDEGCRKAVFAAGDGAFAATVDLTVDAEQPRGTIIVGYEDSGASVATDRVIVTVGTPGVADPPKETQSPEPSATPGARNVVVIGDSLAVGMRPYLAEFLAGWAIDVDARAGRTLEEGMRVFGAEPDPKRDTVYAFSLFTNDDPANVTALESAVRRSSSKGCAVWATIAGAKPYTEANERLNALAAASPDRLRVAQWADRVARNRDWLTDGVHATATGYRNRAALYAAAIKSCTPAG